MTSRRRLLGVIGAAGAAAATCPFAGMAAAAGTLSTQPQVTSGGVAANGHVTDAPVANLASPRDRVAWTGPHQAGITSPRPANGMIAAFGVVADGPEELEDMLRRLTGRIAFLTQGGQVPQLDPRLPPSDSGIVGPEVQPDALTITVSFGASLFDDRPWLAPLRPRCLEAMTAFPNDALDETQCHGDLTLQICANTQDTTIHALRDILKTLPDRLVLRWKQEGNVPVITPGPDGLVESARNFLGFRDGSANPAADDAALMARHVWVGAQRGEPAWAVGGCYQAVRVIRNFVERWDRTPLGEQERIVGRHKVSGAALGQPEGSEFAHPDFAADRDGRQTPMDAHIRLASARVPGAEGSTILRRPFNYSNGVTRAGQLDQGLLFICYQADLDEGFIAVQRRLDGEPLEEYIKPVGGGYFYSLPGVAGPDDYLGRHLIEAVRMAAARPPSTTTTNHPTKQG